MRLSISNLAWDVKDDEHVARLLQELGVGLIDVAPGKYFSDFARVTDKDIQGVKAFWNERGIELYGMQSLLFGTQGLNVFGSVESKESLLKHMNHVCRIAAGLGVGALVFGSPRNRDRSGLNDDDALSVAYELFGRMGDIALSYGVAVCVEPNPSVYGCNFLTKTDEAIAFVSTLNHSAIKIQLDTGTLALNKEDVEAIIPRLIPWLGHIHASEPHLVPLGLGEPAADHRLVGEQLKLNGVEYPVAIEMLVPQSSDLAYIRRVINLAQEAYGK